MTADPSQKQASLVIQRAPAAGEAGAEIYDRRLLAAIRSRTEPRFIDIEPLTTPRAILAMMGARAPHFARWHSSSTQQTVGAAAQSCGVEERIFWLHEVAAQFHLKATAAPSTVVLHNVMSLLYADDQGMVLNPLFRALAVREEHRLAKIGNTDFVVISRGDEAIVRSQAQSDVPIRVLAPGMPPFSHDLSLPAGFSGDIVLDGSYAWWPKRRDLKIFAREVAGSELKNETILAGPSALDSAQDLMQVAPWDEKADLGVLRIGLISDRFVGGFKLKSLMFVAANCLIFTFCDIRPEFAHLPGADICVQYVRNTAELIERRRKLKDMPREELLGAFRAFKQACEAHFSWDRAISEALFPEQAG
jgi:hypothetical protein